MHEKGGIVQKDVLSSLEVEPFSVFLGPFWWWLAGRGRAEALHIHLACMQILERPGI